MEDDGPGETAGPEEEAQGMVPGVFCCGEDGEDEGAGAEAKGEAAAGLGDSHEMKRWADRTRAG
jgi:hypothetical protein